MLSTAPLVSFCGNVRSGYSRDSRVGHEPRTEAGPVSRAVRGLAEARCTKKRRDERHPGPADWFEN